jgi:nucleotide-binding universal stress UspA family protein
VARAIAIRRILVATDLSRGSEGVIDAAIAFGRAFDTSLELIHIADDLAVLLRAGGSNSGRAPAGRGRRLRNDLIDAALAKQCARVRAAGLSCVTTALEGRPASAILSHVRKVNADLMVAGIRPRTQLAHVLRQRVGFDLAKGFGGPVVLVPLQHEPRPKPRAR